MVKNYSIKTQLKYNKALSSVLLALLFLAFNINLSWGNDLDATKREQIISIIKSMTAKTKARQLKQLETILNTITINPENLNNLNQLKVQVETIPNNITIVGNKLSIVEKSIKPLINKWKQTIRSSFVLNMDDALNKFELITTHLKEAKLWKDPNPKFKGDRIMAFEYIDKHLEKIWQVIVTKNYRLTDYEMWQQIELLHGAVFSLLGIKNPLTNDLFPYYTGRVALDNPDARCASNTEIQTAIHSGYLTFFVTLFKILGPDALNKDGKTQHEIDMMIEELSAWAKLVDHITLGENLTPVQTSLPSHRIKRKEISAGDIAFPIWYFPGIDSFKLINHDLDEIMGLPETLTYLQTVEWRAVSVYYGGHHYALLKEKDGTIYRLDDTHPVTRANLEQLFNSYIPSAKSVSVYHQTPRIHKTINENLFLHKEKREQIRKSEYSKI